MQRADHSSPSDPARPSPAPSRPGIAGLVDVRMPPPAAAASLGQDKRRILGMLALGVAGAAAGYLAGKFGGSFLPEIPGPRWLRLLGLAWLPVAWLVAVAWHEFGHLVGGWLIGGRFLLYTVGPVKIQRTPAGIRWGWNFQLNLAGGLAACLPLDPARLTPPRFAAMVLGGPAFSLLLAVAGFMVAPRLGAPGLLGAFLAVGVTLTAGMSALIALATLWPMTAAGFKSDGRRFLDLFRRDRRADQEAAMLALTAAALAGQHPADYDPVLVARATALDDGSLFDLYARLTAFPHAAARGEWRAAQAHLDRILAGESRVAAYVRAAVRCEYAWMLAIHGADAVIACAWLESAGPLDFDPATRLRAEAAVLLAEGRPAEAAARARAGLDALDRQSLSPVRNPFADAALREILRRAEG